MTKTELDQILAKHAAWLRGEAEGERADLRSAYLGSADLGSAYLGSADLGSADLGSADLRSAILSDDTYLPNESFADYKSDVLPALISAGGKTPQELVNAGAHLCNSWTNCPMAFAFDIHSEGDAPPLLKPRVREFVQLFDAHLLDEYFVAIEKGVDDAA